MKTKSVGDVFSILGGVQEISAATGESVWTVSKWKQRKRIPAAYWSALVQLSRRKGENLSADDLLAIHSRRPSPQTAHQRNDFA